jgi:hypothetical protein
MRNGEVRPRLPPDERDKRYARAAIGRVMRRLPPLCGLADLREASELAGRCLEAAELDAEPVMHALLGAAERAGLQGRGVIRKLADAMERGRARPARLPS